MIFSTFLTPANILMLKNKNKLDFVKYVIFSHNIHFNIEEK